IQGKAHKTLTDAVLIDNFQNIRGDLARLKIACQIVETLDNLVIREEKDDQIWQLLDEIFHKLNNCSFFTAHCSLLYYYFFWNLISILGYQPELYLCLVCQKRIIPEKNYFDFEQGGTICKNCADNFLKQSQSRGDAKMTQEISLNVIKILRIFLNKDLLLIKKLKIERKDRELLTKISRYSFLLLSRAL
ncbi:MAG: DNA repair protein RecO, partial [Candidatus Nealsonbacteria bacterium]|nr:DNA repair protein RecO [Candidatus Nealsonbacteria bacterium]